MGRPGLLVEARPTKASSIAARQHSGAGTKIEYTRLAGHKEGGRGIQTGEERRRAFWFHREHASLLLLQGGDVKTLFLRGLLHENAHESNNNGAHIWKLEYQG
jgi:hypothetical protein